MPKTPAVNIDDAMVEPKRIFFFFDAFSFISTVSVLGVEEYDFTFLACPKSYCGNKLKILLEFCMLKLFAIGTIYEILKELI